MKILFRKNLLILISTISILHCNAQTGGDAVINPNSYIGQKIDDFFFDLKQSPGAVSSSTIATNFFVTDDMNGVRIPIYGDDTNPAHPSAGVVTESYYTSLITSIQRAKTARGTKDFYIFASKKLDGQNSFPAWTKDANGIIVTQYVKMLTDYLVFMNSKGIVIDYLGLQNEEQYNEGNLTPQKHVAIVDSLRNITSRLGLKMPKIVGYEDYGPNKNNWMKTMHDNGYLGRMDIYGTHYYPNLRPISNLKIDLGYAGNMPFWSTEPHWDSKTDGNDFNEAEQAICALWDQIDVGMSGFMWWAYSRSGSIKGNLMRQVSVPVKDAQMISMDDIDGKSTTVYKKLQTRAFRNGDLITVYAINNDSTKSYTNYGFKLSEMQIAGNVSYTQWIEGQSITGETANATADGNSTFRLTLPSRSITSFTFSVQSSTDTQTVNETNLSLKILPSLVESTLNIEGLSMNESFNIFNSTGKLMQCGNKNKVDVSTLSPGIYYICTSGLKRSKFIKK